MITDQTVIAGIGNAYSDEILHTAKLSPFATAGKLGPDELDRLHDGDDHGAHRRGAAARSAVRRRGSRARNAPGCGCTPAPACPARSAGTSSPRCRSPTGRSSTARPARPAAGSWPTGDGPGWSSSRAGRTAVRSGAAGFGRSRPAAGPRTAGSRPGIHPSGPAGPPVHRAPAAATSGRAWPRRPAAGRRHRVPVDLRQWRDGVAEPGELPDGEGPADGRGHRLDHDATLPPGRGEDQVGRPDHAGGQRLRGVRGNPRESVGEHRRRVFVQGPPAGNVRTGRVDLPGAVTESGRRGVLQQLLAHRGPAVVGGAHHQDPEIRHRHPLIVRPNSGSADPTGTSSEGRGMSYSGGGRYTSVGPVESWDP